jgi:hypothetical protein
MAGPSLSVTPSLATARAPWPYLPASLSAHPTEPRQDDSIGVVFAQAIDFLEVERALSDCQGRRAFEHRDVVGDWFFPGVSLVSCLLLRRDVVTLEILVGPPRHAVAVEP